VGKKYISIPKSTEHTSFLSNSTSKTESLETTYLGRLAGLEGLEQVRLLAAKRKWTKDQLKNNLKSN
jgi:hypothetical protein